MKELLQLSEKKERLVIGLMSGTSLDGVDLALVKFRGSGPDIAFEVKSFHTYSFPTVLRQRIQKSFIGSVEEICRLNFDLGHFFADLVLDFCKTKKTALETVDLIGSHGQTVFHLHQHSTLQIGEADVIAQKTHTIVVSDFRTADIAVGGSGAPLVPYFDQVLFGHLPGHLALQNLGGIGNVTYLPADRNKHIIAFDTGPANAVLNELTEIISGGEQSYDQDGFFSKQGTCNDTVLHDLLQHSYFQRALPKSTGREEFGKSAVARLMKKYPEVKGVDLLRTCVSLISQSILQAYRRYLPPLDWAIISGGGAHHPLIIKELTEGLKGTRVVLIDTVCDIDADSKEAVAFALLAHEKINQCPTNVPSVTGAQKPVSLGKISIP